eukprot:2281941-Pleurochrysis_carterae.AAC.1
MLNRFLNPRVVTSLDARTRAQAQSRTRIQLMDVVGHSPAVFLRFVREDMRACVHLPMLSPTSKIFALHSLPVRRRTLRNSTLSALA